ncbi:MAG: MerR family DNA-binding transcriptional regulator [Gammaproteobacteria bacterium]|nr:MerR family DNA-binding transcriptional regulator [Gammaproteobacteria bacterium]
MDRALDSGPTTRSDSTSESITYAIGELAGEFGVTSRALRLYEEEGLLKPRRIGTRRIYSERNRVRLRLILRGKRLGWSLSEIKELFDLYDSSHGEEAQLELMLAKLDQRREMLESQKRDIENALEELEHIVCNAQNALDQIRTG